jgi:endoglucanase
VIPTIRKFASDSVVLVGTSTWSQDVNEPADSPLSFPNVMYTCHFYAGTHGEDLRNKIDYALLKGAPIFVSEWGTTKADGNNGVFIKESEEWLSFLDRRGLSWANWSLGDKDESSAALLPGASPEGNWKESDCSDSGRFVFRKLRE